MPTITFYYPEGPFGPTCDIVVDDADDGSGLRDDGDGDGDRYVDTYPELELPDLDRITDGKTPYISLRRCRERVLADGTIEYYDCVDKLKGDVGVPSDYPLIEPSYDWPTFSREPWGLSDNFAGLVITPESCNPHDPDINIIPTKFFKANGEVVLKIPVERSSPVTFPVNAITGVDIIGGGVVANFFGGTGPVQTFKMRWSGTYVDNNGNQTLSADGGGGNGNYFPASTGDWGYRNAGAGYWTSPTDEVTRDEDMINIGPGSGTGLRMNITYQAWGGSANLVASFKQDGTGIIVQGTGTGIINLDFEWDDQVSVSGRSVGTLVIAGQTFTQTSSSTGNQTGSFPVTGGQEYLWTITGQASTAGYRIKDGAIQWDDNAVNGFDKNSEMVNTGISDVVATGSLFNDSRIRVNSILNAGTGYAPGDLVSTAFWNDVIPGTARRMLEIATVDGGVVLKAEGVGDGNVGLNFKWDDNPSTAGQALGSVEVAGQTFTQTSGKERGKQSATVTLTAGQDYPLTITGGSGFGGRSLSDTEICFYDLDGDDCNAKLSIASGGYTETAIENQSAWSEEANKYAVWVNPMVCTLPCLEQSVTYFVDLPATEQYTITGGADDIFEVFLNNETVPVIGGVGGIFDQEHEEVHTGSYTPPYSATRTLQQGTLKIVVKCTNGNAAGGGKTTHMRFVKNVILLRTDGNENVGDFGSQDFTSTDEYFSPIARAVAEEYVSGRFGRSGSYPNRGRPPEPGGMNTHVQYYLNNGGALTDDPVDPTIWAATKTNSIAVGYNVGGQDAFGRGSSEVDAADVDQVYYPSCSLNTPNGFGTTTNENAYKWSLNPGGWYLKICRGSTCVAPTSIPWVRSGPHKSWGDFLDKYAVYPSSTDVLVQTTHTADWNINVPFTGSYELEYSGDDDTTISLDGTQLVTSGYIGPTSNTYTINSLSAGSHVITGTVYNASPPGAFWTQNPGGIGWTLTPVNSATNVSVSFDNSGNLVTTGEGTAQVQLDFAWQTIDVEMTEVSYVKGDGTLVIGERTVGTVSTGAGTQIRTELDGFLNENTEKTVNEVGGFDVPNDSPTKEYLSFGTIQPTTTTTYVRTASITMDLTDTTTLKFDIIAGDDNNGGERPNDLTDVLEINLGSGWMVLAPSRLYANMGFNQYDATYGNWFTFEVTVPESSRTSNFTIQFRSTADEPEIQGTYNGLRRSRFSEAYANCADVFGLYKVTRLFQVDGAALGSIKWSGSGLEFAQTQGVPSGSGSDTAVLDGNTKYNIQVFNSIGGFKVRDNGQKLCFLVYPDSDGSVCNAEVTINTITQGGGGIIASSLDLVAPSDGNLIWHTRKAIGYEYVEIDS